jgi:signal transduction histidine kinase
MGPAPVKTRFSAVGLARHGEPALKKPGHISRKDETGPQWEQAYATRAEKGKPVLGRLSPRTLLEALDGRLSRLGLLGSTLILTGFAVLAVMATHYLLRNLMGFPAQPASIILLLFLEMTVIILPMMLHARRVITELKKSKSELAEMSRRLEIAAEQAHQANRAKSSFLANMSHELRTPLNAIMGFSEVMKDQHMGPVNNPRYLAYAKDIHTSGRYLLGIINDILDLSKIEAGKMSLESAEEFEFSPTVTASLGMIENLGSRFDVEVIDSLPRDGVRLVAVERMVRQILINLVGNAIKFTPAGGTVCVTGRMLPEGGYEMTVRDSGVGMSEDDIKVALTPFGQIANMMGAKHAGTGLGLPLAKAMMELHGGSLTILSAPHKGTAVLLTFPAQRVRPGADRTQQVA